MKTIIAGSRDIWDYTLVDRAVAQSSFNVTEVVDGGAMGVDALGLAYATLNGIPVAPFPAEWTRLGKSAGFARNQRMAEYADALICIHHNSPGSLDMLRRAMVQNLKVWQVVV